MSNIVNVMAWKKPKSILIMLVLALLFSISFYACGGGSSKNKGDHDVDFVESVETTDGDETTETDETIDMLEETTELEESLVEETDEPAEETDETAETEESLVEETDEPAEEADETTEDDAETVEETAEALEETTVEDDAEPAEEIQSEDDPEEEAQEAESESEEEAPLCKDDSFETNDSIETAAQISEGTISALTLCPGADDYYKFEAENGFNIQIDIQQHLGEGGLEAKLYYIDPTDGAKIAAEASQTQYGIRIWHKTEKSGQYVVWVFGQSDDQGIMYSLRTALFCLPATIIASGETKPGQTKADGANLLDGYSCEPSTSASGSESIFYYFAECDGKAQAELTASEDADLDLFVLKGCGADDCLTQSRLGGSTEWVEFDVTKGSKYYFVIDSAKPIDALFSLKLTVKCSACVDKDEDGYYEKDALACPAGNDCNDLDKTINPGAVEVACDGKDNDCSLGDFCSHLACVDDDRDTFYGYDPVSCPMGKDCNDSRSDVKPGAEEIKCDGIDQDCDGFDDCYAEGTQCKVCFGECAEGYYCLPYMYNESNFMFYCMRDCSADRKCPTGSTCVGDYGSAVCIPDKTYKCDSSGSSLTIGNTCGYNSTTYTCGAGLCDENAKVCKKDCAQDAKTINAGETVVGHTGTGEKIISNYGCINGLEGSEVVYKFKADCSGNAVVKLDNMSSAYLHAVVLKGACNSSKCLEASATSGLQTSIDFPIAQGTDYYIVVDGENFDDTGRFGLTLERYCGTTAQPHCGACVRDFDCAGAGKCLEFESSEPQPIRACVADCSIDGKCPVNSDCKEIAPAEFKCVPVVGGSCVGSKLYASNSCGQNYLVKECAAGESCNAEKLSCDTGCLDEDGDGYFGYDAATCPSGTDCDDSKKLINPGASDIRCNLVDEDCSGGDNCVNAKQCEPCVFGHCAKGFECKRHPGYEEYGFCVMVGCGDSGDCPSAPSGQTWDLTCASWNDGPYYCMPETSGACAGGKFTKTDGCGHQVYQQTCEIACYANFGCLNYCDTASVLSACGQILKGDTRGAQNKIEYYYNSSYTIQDRTGGELSYKYTAECDGEISASIESDANLTLAIVRASGTHCKPSSLIDYAWAQGDNRVNWIAAKGSDYYLVVDGMDGAEGAFTVKTSCFCSQCKDLDNDTYMGYDPVNCPQGTDCDDDNKDAHPKATDIQCNRIDENCDGYDDCPTAACLSSVSLNCGETVHGSNVGIKDAIAFYGGSCNNYYAETAGEAVYKIAPGCVGKITAKMANATDDYLGLYILEDKCQADKCAASGWFEASVNAKAATDYYVVVDGYNRHSGEFDLTVNCACYDCKDNDDDKHYGYDETKCPSGDDCNDDDGSVYTGAPEIECNGKDENCDGYDLCANATCHSNDSSLSCGDSAQGSTKNAANQVTFWGGSCPDWLMSGGEKIYSFTSYCTGVVTATVNTPLEGRGLLNLFVAKAECKASSCVAYGENSATFQAGQGVTYYIAVDGFEGYSGDYQLAISCGCK